MGAAFGRIHAGARRQGTQPGFPRVEEITAGLRGPPGRVDQVMSAQLVGEPDPESSREVPVAGAALPEPGLVGGCPQAPGRGQEGVGHDPEALDDLRHVFTGEGDVAVTALALLGGDAPGDENVDVSLAVERARPVYRASSPTVQARFVISAVHIAARDGSPNAAATKEISGILSGNERSGTPPFSPPRVRCAPNHPGVTMVAEL